MVDCMEANVSEHTELVGRIEHRLIPNRFVGHRRSRIYANSLTPREREVVMYVAVAMIDREIAKVMGITLGSVKEYMIRIRRKLGARNRVAVVMWYVGQQMADGRHERSNADAEE